MGSEVDVAWTEAGGAPFVANERVQDVASTALAYGGLPGVAVSVVFVGEDELSQMHAEHLDDPTPTDVITFDLSDSDDGFPGASGVAGPVGELYVSVDRAREVSEARNLRVEAELMLYVVHGCLHLCGFDDHKDEERAAMRVAERAVLDQLQIKYGTGPHDWSNA